MVDLKRITAESLERIRKREGLSHSELADKLGINRTTLYLYESGKRILPTEMIYRLHERLGIEPNEVLKIVKD